MQANHPMEPFSEHAWQMEREHHAGLRWLYMVAAVVGVWLVLSPFVFGHADPQLAGPGVARVTEERSLPSIEVRGALMAWSDALSGVAVIALALLSLNHRRVWAQWALGGVGLWLLLAPMVFWSPTVAAFVNDSLIGIALIAMTILVGGMPGMRVIMRDGPEIPPGWSYNPSAWIQRAPIIGLGWIGFFGARYMGAYQLGYLDTAWDPFFGPGTVEILESEVSRAWPVSDALLGSTVYALEALMGYMGGTDRWRTMPWMVGLFGILVVPLGVVSIALVIMQPVAVGTWCTICLATAVAMLVMIPLTLDEVVAMLQFLVRRVREGVGFWDVFLFGDTVEGGAADERSPDWAARLAQTAPASVWGVTLPWTLLVQAAVGVWLMASPYVVGEPLTPAADSSVLSGALVTTVAGIALAEVTRAARFLNLALALWIAVGPWLLGAPLPAAINALIVAGILIGTSLPRGPIRERYGNWQPFMI
jgi:hypothetical protein